jgi:HPr kinase/phosphorylase
MPTPTRELRHASCVAIGPYAVLILGRSGAGKSTLALDLMSRGAGLVADDQTQLDLCDGTVLASAAPGLEGRIEARGVGLLAADYVGQTLVILAVDLDQSEPDRLPPRRHLTLLGVEIELIFGADHPNLAPVIHQRLRGERVA